MSLMYHYVMFKGYQEALKISLYLVSLFKGLLPFFTLHKNPYKTQVHTCIYIMHISILLKLGMCMDI